MRTVLGIFMLVALFGGLFAACSCLIGWRATAVIYGITATIAAWAGAIAWLL